MVLDAIESERKLDAAAGFAMPDLDGVVEGVVAVGLPERRMTATYVDTADLRLLRAGVTLRHRVEREADGTAVAEWTLKLPLPPGGTLLRRRELRWPAGDEAVPAEAEVLVRPWRRLDPLRPVARLLQVRQRTELRHGGAAVAEVDDDVVSVMDGPHLAARFRQVELELAAEAPRRLLPAVLARLEAAGARAGDDRSKLERALGPAAAAPPDVASRTPGPKARVGEVVASAAAAWWSTLAAHHGGLVLGDDPDDVDAALAATRRLACELEVLGAALDQAWAVATRHDLAWLGGLLGELHRLEAVAARVRLGGAGLPDQDQPALGALRDELAAQRAERRGALVAALGAERYAALLDRVALASAHPPVVEHPVTSGSGEACDEPGSDGHGCADRGSDADGERGSDVAGDGGSDVAGGGSDAAGGGVDDGASQWPGEASQWPGEAAQWAGEAVPRAGGAVPRAGEAVLRAGGAVPRAGGRSRASAVLPGLVAPALAALTEALGELDGPPAGDDLAALAGRCGALRHGAALAAPACGEGAARLAAAAADLDAVLGDLADGEVAGAWLRGAGLAGSAPVALAAGQLLGATRAGAEEGRRAWPAAAKHVRRKKLRAWLVDD